CVHGFRARGLTPAPWNDRGFALLLAGQRIGRGFFRDMTLARFEAAERVEAETVAEPVEERGDVAGGPHLASACASDGLLRSGGRIKQSVLLRRQGIDGEDGKDHVLDAEAGIDRVEPGREQCRQMARIAARPGGADGDVLDPSVNPVKAEGEPARANAPARE